MMTMMLATVWWMPSVSMQTIWKTGICISVQICRLGIGQFYCDANAHCIQDNQNLSQKNSKCSIRLTTVKLESSRQNVPMMFNIPDILFRSHSSFDINPRTTGLMLPHLRMRKSGKADQRWSDHGTNHVGMARFLLKNPSAITHVHSITHNQTSLAINWSSYITCII